MSKRDDLPIEENPLGSEEKPTVTGEIDLIAEAAKTMRRVTAAMREPDPDGLETIWHQGQHRTELLSWVRPGAGEGQRPTIVKQQLHFMGHIVELKNAAIRTGHAIRPE